MQQLQVEFKNVPKDVQSLLVLCSTSSCLNKDESLSDKNKVLACNDPEGVQHRKVEHSLLVFIQNREGKPLMPCSARKARKLLQEKKATVVKRFPFTIRLVFGSSGYKQKVILGIDSGYKNIGFSAVSEIKELISGTVKLDDKTSERLTERRMYRKGRRTKLWHREPRFLNRSKPEGWLPPSIERRYDTHLNLINRLTKILPVQEIIIEVANFDIQKIMNPDIQGIEYQQGSLYEHQNTRSYLMAREHGKCQICSKDFKGQPIHIHHCKQKKDAGSNRPENLAILHKACHEKLHKQGLKLLKPKSYQPNTFMSIIHKRFWKDIPDLKVTYGHITFVNRKELGLEKSHSNDAFVIANGTVQERSKSWDIEQKHRHNRAIQLNRKGFKPSIRTSVYKIQPKDWVKIDGRWKETSGVHCKGTRLIVDKKSISIKQVQSIFNTGSFIWRTAIPPMLKNVGFLAEL